MRQNFIAHIIEETITWGVFCELCDITDRLFVADMDSLKEAYKNGGVTDKMELSYRYERIISVGLLSNDTRAKTTLTILGGGEEQPRILIELSEIGNIFCEAVFDNQHLMSFFPTSASNLARSGQTALIFAPFPGPVP